MLGKEQALAKLKELVETFSSASKNKEYINAQNEEWVKWNYIEPLLEILGWKRGDIEKEYRVLKGRADYLLKIGNEEVLVVEAKKVSVSLSEEEGRQAVSYAYHRKIRFAVLTNFKEVRVYHALSNIRNIDKNLLKFESGGYFRFTYDQFLNNLDKLSFLSRESIEKKELDNLLSKKDEKAAKPIDKSILDDLLEIREWLSKDLKKLRAHLTKEQIDEIVQILIDRLIFMRSVEDRGLEERDFLLKMVGDFQEGRTDKRLWDSLKIKFRIFDKEYNSKLFAEGLLEKEGFFDEQTLSEVIKELYFGNEGQQERYMFDEIPGDLLGNIYEQYLGTILADTEKRVKLDSASGKRKRMGIYYTPSYIVDYIVKNTVYEYIKNKTIDEILEVNIVDPACGSGSFLIKAFECVCNIIEEKLKKGEKGKSLSFQDYNGRLSLVQKASILSNCIYGVDLDEKAVELAQLNLLLKLLEEETQETRKRILPNMKENIKCGNSLIDDFTIAGDKAFKWEAQFPEAFHKGGFDVVIGNPPYIRIQTLDKKDVEYFNNNYESPEKNYDIYILFVEKGYKLIKSDGKVGYILPHKFFQGENGSKIRYFLSQKKTIKKIVDFTTNQIFEGATTYTCLLFLSKENNNIFDYVRFNLGENYRDLSNRTVESFEEACLGKEMWNFGSKSIQDILDKIRSGNRFDEITEKIFKGSSTGNDEIYLLDLKKDKGKIATFYSKHLGENIDLEKEVLCPFIYGEDIKRYFIDKTDKFLLFPYKFDAINNISLISLKEMKNKFPLTYSYFNRVKDVLLERKVELGQDNFYKYSAARSLNEYQKPKIMIPDMLVKIRAACDIEGIYYHGPAIHGVVFKDKFKNINNNFFLGILNSRLFWFFIVKTSTALRGDTYRLTPEFLNPFAFPKQIDRKQEQNLVLLVDRMLSLQKKLHDSKISGSEKERLEQQIKNLDYEIDQEVYALYGITKEEQKIIEESLNQ